YSFRRRITPGNAASRKVLQITRGEHLIIPPAQMHMLTRKLDLNYGCCILPGRKQPAFPSIKATFLLHYRRVFPLPAFQKLCNMFIAFIIAFGIAQVVSTCLACVPLRSLWDLTVPGRCIALLDWWLIGSSINLVTDVAIFVMPIPLLRSIMLPLRQKIVLMATFGLGFFTCAISVVRITTLKTSSTSDDPTYNTVIAGVWSITEVSCAIICVCVPTFRPLIGGQNSRIRPPSWLRPNLDESDNTELYTQSDEGVSSHKRRSRALSGLQQAGGQQELESARNSSPRPRPRPRIDLSDVPGLVPPPVVHVTPYEDSPFSESPGKDTMLPLTRFDTEEGVEFLNIDGPEAELPTPLKPPPRRHTNRTPSPEGDGYFGAVVWDESDQPRLAGSPPSA
ncbi:integral membrane protein, partial [Colletotrichum incanum]